MRIPAGLSEQLHCATIPRGCLLRHLVCGHSHTSLWTWLDHHRVALLCQYPQVRDIHPGPQCAAIHKIHPTPLCQPPQGENVSSGPSHAIVHRVKLFSQASPQCRAKATPPSTEYRCPTRFSAGCNTVPNSTRRASSVSGRNHQQGKDTGCVV